MLWQVYTAPFYIADDGNTTVTAVSYAPDRPPMYSEPVTRTYSLQVHTSAYVFIRVRLHMSAYSEPVTRTYSLQAAAWPPIYAASAAYADIC
jgi:hypothetical protein